MDPFTSSQLSAAIHAIYLRGKRSKFKIGVYGPPKLTNGMVALAVVVVSIHDAFWTHHDNTLTIYELKVSAWMQDMTLTEAVFKDEYHRALKHIAKNSERILRKLSTAAEIPGASKMDTDIALPSAVKMPKVKKM